MQNVKIAVSGELGSGKSVLSQKLCEKYNFELISIGSIQRELAKEHGMTTVEFNEFMEHNPAIDNELDKRLIKHGQSNNNIIFDSRLAWHFIPQSFKIHLIININIAAERIYNDKLRRNESYKNINDTIKGIKYRRNSEINRFIKLYNINIQNYINYDLVLDTSYLTPDYAYEFASTQIELWENKHFTPSIWISPMNLYPTQDIREHSQQHINEICKSMKENGFDTNFPIEVIRWENSFYIFNGHKRCASALQNNLNLVPVNIKNLKENKLYYNQKISEFIKDNFSFKKIYDWEDMNKFKFPESIIF